MLLLSPGQLLTPPTRETAPSPLDSSPLVVLQERCRAAPDTKLTPSVLHFREELLPKMKESLTGFQSLLQTSSLERHKLQDVCPKKN